MNHYASLLAHISDLSKLSKYRFSASYMPFWRYLLYLLYLLNVVSPPPRNRNPNRNPNPIDPTPQTDASFDRNGTRGAGRGTLLRPTQRLASSSFPKFAPLLTLSQSFFTGNSGSFRPISALFRGNLGLIRAILGLFRLVLRPFLRPSLTPGIVVTYVIPRSYAEIMLLKN